MQLVGPGKIVWDLGANVGLFTFEELEKASFNTLAPPKRLADTYKDYE